MPDSEKLRAGFELGEWQVLPERNLLRCEGADASLERLAMDVLVVLAARQGELVTKDDLVDAVWDGRPQMDDVITQKISLIRKALGDMSKPHRYVETIFGRGYRMKMAVTLPEGSAEELPESPPRRVYWLAWVGGVAALGVVVSMVFLKPDASPTGAPDGPMNSVVVFPFQCSREDDAHLCDGFSQLLASTLSQLDGLHVVKSRTSYPENKSDIQIAEEFSVDGVIWGAVVRVDEAFAVNADLVDGRSGYVEFSRLYDSERHELLDTQDRVANDVRRKIRGESSPELVTSSRPANYQVLELFWEADYEFAKRQQLSIHRAIELYNEAIAEDSMFGPTYLSLAYATALLPDYDATVDRYSNYDSALEYARQGVQMDPSMEIPAATVYGFVHHKMGDWIASQENYEISLEGDVVEPQTHQLYSRLLASVGRLEESLHQARQARALDPESAVLISRLAISYYWMGDVENARALFELIEDRPDFGLPVNDLAYALLLLSQDEFDKAVSVATKALDNAELNSEWVEPIFLGLEDPDKTESAVELVRSLSEDGLLPPIIEISLWTLFDYYDEAMAIARRIKTEGELFEAEVLFSPDFRGFRNHRDFLALMDTIGIGAYWEKFDCNWADDAVHCP